MKKQNEDDVRQNNIQKNKKKALLVAKNVPKDELKPRQLTKQNYCAAVLRSPVIKESRNLSSWTYILRGISSYESLFSTS